MTVALAFGRWDVDVFLSEIPDDLFREWLEFHCTIQPLDAAYVTMRGLMGSPKQERNTGGGWEQSKMNLIRHMKIANGQKRMRKKRGD